MGGGSTTTARSTIIALNNGPSGPDICGPLTSQNFNLVGNNAGATIMPQSSDQIGTPGAPIDPLLGPLQYNGGPTFTCALQSNSPAINSGDPNAPPRDQRGYLRAGVSDIGAFEFGGTVPVSLGNISTHLRVEIGDNVLIGGFIITGMEPKKVIVRAVGPSLPLAGVLADPIWSRPSWHGRRGRRRGLRHQLTYLSFSRVKRIGSEIDVRAPCPKIGPVGLLSHKQTACQIQRERSEIPNQKFEGLALGLWLLQIFGPVSPDVTSPLIGPISPAFS